MTEVPDPQHKTPYKNDSMTKPTPNPTNSSYKASLSSSEPQNPPKPVIEMPGTFKGSETPTTPQSSPKTAVTNTTEVPDSTIDPVFVYKSYLTDIDYSEHQKRYVEEKIVETDETCNNDFRLQRDFFTQQIKDKYGYTLQSLWTPNFEMRSLVYYATNKEGKNVMIKVSPDSNSAGSNHGIFNEWYVLSGLNVVEPADLNDKRSYLDSFQISVPRTLPNDMPGIVYPDRMLTLDHPDGRSKKFAVVYTTREFATLVSCHQKDLQQEVHDSTSSSSSKRHNSLPNNYTKQSILGSSVFSQGEPSVSSAVLEDSFRLREISRTPSEVVDILADVIELVKILSRIHELGIVYNTLSSSNVFKSLVNGTIKLAGFEYCFSVQPEDGSNAFRRPYLTKIPDHLAYMSPESIDDSHKGADFRTDLYSVGVMMYELLVGRLPFISSNPAKLIRMQVLHKPVAPEVIAGNWITGDLNNLVMRLLEKDPWKRYADCISLIDDLVGIRDDYIAESGTTDNTFKETFKETFTETKFDDNLDPQKKVSIEKSYATQAFILPRKLFGRDDVNDKIINIFNNMSTGVNIALVEGPPGTGKTTLLRDLRDMAIGAQDFYIYHKFSKTGENESVYEAFVAGLTICVDQILRCSVEVIESWRHKIISSVPIDLSIMMQLIPEFRTLIGPKYSSILKDRKRPGRSEQYPEKGHYETGSGQSVPEEFNGSKNGNASGDGPTVSDGLEAQTLQLELRLRYLIKALFRVFCTNGITIVLDDVQFCSKNEWRMSTEILDFFTKTEAQGEISAKYFISINPEPDSFVKSSDLEDAAAKYNVPFTLLRLGPISLVDFTQYWSYCVVSHSGGDSKRVPTSQESMIPIDTQTTTNTHTEGLKASRSRPNSPLSQSQNHLSQSEKFPSLKHPVPIPTSTKTTISPPRPPLKSPPRMSPSMISPKPITPRTTMVNPKGTRASPSFPPPSFATLSFAPNTFSPGSIGASSAISVQNSGAATSGAAASPFAPKFQVSVSPQSTYIDEKLIMNAEELYKLSKGNILHSRYISTLIYWQGKANYISRRGNVDGKWYFDFSDPSIQNQTLKDTIMACLDTTLSPKCRKLMKFAALIFTSDFNLAILSKLADIPLDETFKLLTTASRVRLIVPMNPFYKIPFHLLHTKETPFDIPQEIVWELASKAEFRFFHDSLRDALYEELTVTGELEQYRQLCGLRYHQYIQSQPFSSVKYMKMGKYFCDSISLATEQNKDLYLEVLITTGRICVCTYKFDDALKCFTLASSLVSDTDPKLQLKLFLTICQLQYYSENYETCLELIETGCKKFEVDESAFLVTKVRCLSNLHKFDELLQVSTRGLQRLGIEISTDPEECEQITLKYHNRTPLALQEIRDLKSLPKAKDPKITLAYEVMANIIQPTYFASYIHIKKALVYQMVYLMSKHGTSVFCAIALLFIGNNLAKQIEKSKFLRAAEYVKVAMGLVDTSQSVSFSYIQTIYELYITTIASYIEPLPDLVRYHETFLSSVRTFYTPGSWTRDMITGVVSCQLLYLTGHSYTELKRYLDTQDYEYYQIFSSKYRDLQVSGLQLFHNEISVEEFDTTIDKSIKSPDYVFVAYCFKIFSLISSGKAHDAISLVIHTISEVDETIPNTLLHMDYYFNLGIALTQINRTSETETEKLLAAKVLSYFGLFNEVCPTNFKPRYLMMNAALNVDKYSDLERLDMFEEALELVKASGNMYDEAWGNLLCGKWLMSTHLFRKKTTQYAKASIVLFTRLELGLCEQFAHSMFDSYINTYSWAGIDTLDNSPRTPMSPRISSPNPLNKKLSEFFVFNYQTNSSRKEYLLGSTDSKRTDTNSKRIDGSSRRTIPLDESVFSEETINLNEAVKACLDISDANNDGLILMRLLQCAIQFSDVDYGVIVTKKNLEPFISAIGSRSSIYNLLNEPLSSRTDLCPYSLIQYVLSNGEIVNKDEDSLLFDTNFSKDDYYQSNSCYSLICIPLKSSKGIEGALYLESQQELQRRPSVEYQPFFNSTKCDLIELLCSQATVALTKIELYTQMEHAKRIAEDATAEKASFLANMSHEIRTPFNSLLSCSIFLLDTELSKTQREYVETIRSSAMVTLNIIDGILAFSKIEHGSFTLSNEPFSLIESVENAIQLVGEQAALSNLELVFFNKCPEIKSILGDETRFRQIIINLVGNAVKFTSEGHIIVEVKSKEITQNRYEICVSVEDTGIGIPKDSTNKVFGAFSQVDSSSRRIYGGSGLGLAISKKLADLMGGALTFDSVEGKGSTFYFVVNMEVELFQHPEIVFDDKIAAELGTTRKSLVIDSHKLTRRSLFENLEMFGLEVDIIDSAEELLMLPPKQISSYNSLFIHYDKFLSFNNIKGKLELNMAAKIILISQFGKSLPPQVDDSQIFSVLLVPFQKPKIMDLLINLMSSQKQIIKPEPKLEQSKPIEFAKQYPLNILIAEDNLINLRVALQHLKKLGYQADHAKDGVEVIDKCIDLLHQEKHYDVIFMDIQMPRKDGITATIELRQLLEGNGKSSYLPEIVALTANVAGEDRKRSLECGMIDFISKPILPQNLVNVLKKIGERRR